MTHSAYGVTKPSRSTESVTEVASPAHTDAEDQLTKTHLGESLSSPNASPTKANHEFGVRYRWANGQEFDSGPSSLAFCRLAVQAQRSDKAGWNPRAVAVLVREPSEWRLLDESDSESSR